jgi:hypothetical protein
LPQLLDTDVFDNLAVVESDHCHVANLIDIQALVLAHR